LRDSDIRTELERLLRSIHLDDTLFRHELGLCSGKRRIDLALVNGELSGYEIKSDEDTLHRLAGQAAEYGRVLDRAFLVTTQRHLHTALRQLPDWWGVLVASSNRGRVEINVAREEKVNRTHDPLALAQLLWREEALDELRLRGKSHGLLKKARYYIWVALTEAVEITELRQIVRDRLKARRDWPGGQPCAPDDAMYCKPTTQ